MTSPKQHGAIEEHMADEILGLAKKLYGHLTGKWSWSRDYHEIRSVKEKLEFLVDHMDEMSQQHEQQEIWDRGWDSLTNGENEHG